MILLPSAVLVTSSTDTSQRRVTCWDCSAGTKYKVSSPQVSKTVKAADHVGLRRAAALSIGGDGFKARQQRQAERIQFLEESNAHLEAMEDRMEKEQGWLYDDCSEVHHLARLTTRLWRDCAGIRCVTGPRDIAPPAPASPWRRQPTQSRP
jgi:hypothetical protein